MKKRLVFLAIVVGIAIYVIHSQREKQEEAMAADYERIEQLRQECEMIVNSKYLYTIGAVHAWHVYELELIHKDENELLKRMEQDLGEDFKTKLHNGDKLYVGFLPDVQKYYIYAGKALEDEYMLYPDWNYTKLEKR